MKKLMTPIPFVYPTEEVRKKALEKYTMPPKLKPIFAGISKFWKPIYEPEPGEWLDTQDEPGQPFQLYEFLMESRYNVFEHKGPRKFIYILPLDTHIQEESLSFFQEYIEAFFLPAKVKIMKPYLAKKDKEIKQRKHDGVLQIHAGQILDKLQSKVPLDAYSMIAITLTDMYHKEQWNFIYGLGSISDRVGVFSLARCNPRFFGEGEDLSETQIRQLIEFRGVKVMVHELTHMFGIRHCIYYCCVMCGSMSPEEGAKKPLFLCPICVRKLQCNLQFDYVARYERLAKVCLNSENPNFVETGEWYKERQLFIKSKIKKKATK